jgi:predicted deacylase
MSNKAQPLVIDGTIIKPGEYKVLKIVVGRLPTDNQISIHCHIYRGKKPGPVILLQAGVHGDEINGIETLRRMISDGTFKSIQKGTVIVIPLLNVFGFINFSREVPDGKDINRSFPGSSKGSLASRIASKLTQKIIPHVNYAIDLHTGGADRYNYPQVRFSKGNKESEEIAKAFGVKYLIKKSTISHSFRRICKNRKIPMVVFEGGESFRTDNYVIEQATRGIKNVLNHFSMLEFNDGFGADKKILIKKTIWQRAAYAGLFQWTKSSGQQVKKGEKIGHLNDPFGNKSIKVIAKRDGHIIGHNNASVVNQGDALFHIGYETETIHDT